MIRRLFWVGVGVAVTVVVVRRGKAVAEQYLPTGATEVVDGVGRLSRAVRTAAREFSAGMAERETQLRAELIGDVDIEALHAQAPERLDALRSQLGRPRRSPVPPDWAGTTQDPDDDDGYTFF